MVALSSIGHLRSGVHFDDIHYRQRPYDKWEAYGQSKTANALFAVGFHQRFKDRGVTANAVMPGGIMTPLQRHLPREEMIAMGWMTAEGVVSDRFKTTAQGASTSVWAAVGPELQGVGGLYLEDCAQAAAWSAEVPFKGVMAYALDPAAAERLWEVSAATTGVSRMRPLGQDPLRDRRLARRIGSGHRPARRPRRRANIAVAAKTAEPHKHLPGTIYTAAEEIQGGPAARPCRSSSMSGDEASVQAGVESAARGSAASTS